MLPPILPSSGFGSPVFWFAVLMWGVFFVVVVMVNRYQRSSARRHRRYRRQAARVLQKLPMFGSDGRRLCYLRKINPFVFEELLLLAFERQGYRVKRNLRYSGDGGLDGQVWIDGQHFLIQAKRYSRAINPQHVADFARLLKQRHTAGLFIHTGRTGVKSRIEAVQSAQLHIISGQKLLVLLAKGRDDKQPEE
ncbi:restriction endonuclease [Morganella morganii]|nr:restriction endonuclease [Morganella morganii]